MKKRICAAAAVLIICMTQLLSVWASDRELPLMYDGADLLTSGEEQEIEAFLEEISENHQCEVAVVTVNSLEGKTARLFADDFYDFNGYGYGENDDGIMLVISMEERQWAITSYGTGISAFTQEGQEYIMDMVLDDLSDGYYRDAFMTFAGQTERFLTQWESGEAYGEGNMPVNKTDLAIGFLVSLIAGVVVSLIVMLALMSKNKTVVSHSAAADYLVPGSLNVTASQDIFLYQNLARTPVQKNDGSSSGGGFSIGSSGRTHGGSSGSF
ncbi:MAG: TPM domain-containing protein [Bacillota bacterium]|nr:TPM domain-containing protein [Bacillota bacterium]